MSDAGRPEGANGQGAADDGEREGARAAEDKAPSMIGETKDYRQPLVTSLGIMLGFLLNYLATWANSTDSGSLIESGTDAAIFVTIVLAASMMVIVLYRMLDPRAGRGDPVRHYQLTLKLYVASIVVAFVGFMFAVVL